MGIKVTKDVTADVLANIKKLVEQDILIGVPQGSDERQEGSAINNAELAYIHTYGGTIQMPSRDQTIYRKVDRYGDYANSGRFVKQSKSNFATTHHVDAYTITLPPRPYLFIGIKNARLKIEPHMKAAALAALSGKPGDIRREMAKAGLVAVDVVKDVFTSGELAPLAQSTITQKGGKDNPLLLTGQLRDATQSVLRDK